MAAPFPIPMPLAELFGSGEMLVMFLLVLIFFGGDRLPDLPRGLGKIVRKFGNSDSDHEAVVKRAMEEAVDKEGHAIENRANRKFLWRGVLAIAVGIVIVTRAFEEIYPRSAPGMFAPGRPAGAAETYVTLGLGLAVLYLGSWWCAKKPRE
jgi:sec-independent protein translocase protein TatA